MGKSKIDWGIPDLHTWNPVVGCPRGCPYCVVRKRVWHRIRHLFGNGPYEQIAFLEERLAEPLKRKKPTTYFTGFYSDCMYWKKEHFYAILSIIHRCPQHKFMFLSKDYRSYNDYDWPNNTGQGLTLTCEPMGFSRYSNGDYQQQAIEGLCYASPHPFLSIEPLLGLLEMTVSPPVERVIVGAQTGPGSVVPKKEWIDSIKANCNKDKLYWKNNIRKYL